MNILTDHCPDEVTVDGRSYKIVTDWKDWVRFYCMLDDPDLRDRDREYIAMQYFTESEPTDSDEAMKALIKFASGEDMPQAGKSNKQAVTKKAACFSWLYDGAFVLSAFRQYYGIDLRTEKMHWYIFLSLFQGIPDDSPLKKRMQLRTTNVSSIKDREHRQNIIKAQNAVALPQKELGEKDICENIFDAFFSDGGD